MVNLPRLRWGADGQNEPARSLAGPRSTSGECVAPVPTATIRHETAGKKWARSRSRLALTCFGGVRWLGPAGIDPARAPPSSHRSLRRPAQEVPSSSRDGIPLASGEEPYENCLEWGSKKIGESRDSQ